MSQVITDVPMTFGTRTVPATMTYDTADPYAVRMTIDGSDWFVDRELLSEGLVRRVGEGDIAMSPTVSLLKIHLSSPSGKASLVARKGRIEQFLLDTYELVQLGCEWTFVDIDSELDLLLCSDD